jgi:hypothetical protein
MAALCHYGRSHRAQRRPYAAQMQHGIETTLVAAFDGRGPGIGSGGLGMALQVEDMDGAIPNNLAAPNLYDGHSFDQHGLPPVLAFNCLLELIGANVHAPILARFYPALFPHCAPPFISARISDLELLSARFRRFEIESQLHRQRRLAVDQCRQVGHSLAEIGSTSVTCSNLGLLSLLTPCSECKKRIGLNV